MNKSRPTHGQPVVESTVIRWILLVVLLVLLGAGVAVSVVALVGSDCLPGGCPYAGGGPSTVIVASLVLVAGRSRGTGRRW